MEEKLETNLSGRSLEGEDRCPLHYANNQDFSC